MAEEVSRAGQRERHRAQLAQDLVPLSNTRPFLIDRDARQDLGQPLHAVGRQRDRHVHSVNDPTEDQLDSSPGAIALEQFLHGDGLAPKRIVERVQWTEYIVDRVHQRSAHATAVAVLLRQRDEVVDEDVDVGCSAASRRQAWVPRRRHGCANSRPLDPLRSPPHNLGVIVVLVPDPTLLGLLQDRFQRHPVRRRRWDLLRGLVKPVRGRRHSRCQAVVCQIRGGLSRRREDRRAILPSHRQNERESNKLLLARLGWECNAKLGDVVDVEVDAVEAVTDVHF